MSPIITPTLPTVGQPNATEDVDIVNALTTIVNAINGDLDTANFDAAAGITADQLASAVAAAVGLSQTGAARRGKSIIATEEARTSTSYGLLTTPDQVQSVVMPTDGLIKVGYQALWKNSVANAGRAAIFLGSNQLKRQEAAAPAVSEVSGNTTANVYVPLHSTATGLGTVNSAAAYGSDVTTGQLVGGGLTLAGIAYIFAAAGTYDISVQFKSTSGSVTVKERKLWVEAVGF